MLHILFTFIFLFFSFSTYAKVRVVEIEKHGAAVYKKPSFDARVIIQLKRGQKLYSSDKKIQGLDGMGLFYKVRLKKGIYGYVLDTALKGFVPKGPLSSSPLSGKRKKRERSDRQDHYAKTSPYYTKSYGILLQSLRYSLKFQDDKKSSQEGMFGLSLSGPGWLLKSFPLNINLSFAPSPPALFDSFTQDQSGYFAFLEASIPFEIRRGKNWAMALGIGAVLSHYDYKVTINSVEEPSSSTDLGLVGNLGAGYRIGRYFLKADFKYYKIKSDHMAFALRFQRIF